VITLPTAETPLASRIATDKKYKTFFTDGVGALDGTHINVHLSPDILLGGSSEPSGAVEISRGSAGVESSRVRAALPLAWTS